MVHYYSPSVNLFPQQLFVEKITLKIKIFIAPFFYLCRMSKNDSSQQALNSYLAEAGIATGGLTINDIREKEFSGKALSKEEKQALANFDKFRILELNKQVDDNSFHKRYRELQVMANFGNYEEFLKEKYEGL